MYESKSSRGKKIIEEYILKCPDVNHMNEIPGKFRKYISEKDFQKYDNVKYSKFVDDKIFPEKHKAKRLCFKIE